MADNNGHQCPYYELDENAKKRADEMERLLRGSMDEEEWQFLERHSKIVEKYDPCTGCYLCKFFCTDGTKPGFPGETVYDCSCPGYEHIIHIDFDLSAVI